MLHDSLYCDGGIDMAGRIHYEVYRICDICNYELKVDEVGHYVMSYLLCPKCWELHLQNERELASRVG